ncbi:hypothetical protein [Amycolatopsis minnesotensis]|uniref:Uncharacterized protein n=1 Tax=Amycolatopsis minnesotensis TaxID=337894 RepID=A0ABP5DS21_9PSEU
MRDTSDTHDDWPGALATLTRVLETMPPDDITQVLATAWEGLLAARWCGLAAAADPRWKARQGNAETCEYDLATQFSYSLALADRTLTLPAPDATVAPLQGEAADAAVAAIIGYTTVTNPLLLAAGNHHGRWEDQRACLHSARLMTSLGECWEGHHPCYRR